MIDEAARLDHPGVVDRRMKQRARRHRGKQHVAAISRNQAAVACQCLECTLVDGHVQQPVSCDIKRYGVASSKRDCAKPGGNQPVVADVGTQQRDVTTVGLDRAFVQHRIAA